MKKILVTFLFFIIFFSINPTKASAYGECSQYGFMSMYDGLGSCTCMSGYSFGKDLMGQTSCISDYQKCKDTYGYNATSDYSGNCKCLYGYGFGKNTIGKTQCISLNSMCEDELGYNSSYDSLSDSCKCRYGYVIKSGRCVDAENLCTSEHGLNSSYNSISKQCSCDSGYTFDENGRCVEKQNNVYFTLKELDSDDKKAIIKSDHDYSYYSVEYNSGCYASSFERYLNHQIVVNLGTDFSLDTWDKIVLQDDDETCDITQRERVDSTFSFEIEDEDSMVYIEPVINSNKRKTIVTELNPQVEIDNEVDKTIKAQQAEEIIPKAIEPIKKIQWYRKILNWFRSK